MQSIHASRVGERVFLFFFFHRICTQIFLFTDNDTLAFVRNLRMLYFMHFSVKEYISAYTCTIFKLQRSQIENVEYKLGECSFQHS